MVLVNTNINFIQPSGGVLRDIDHIELIPLGSGLGLLDFSEMDNPDLPSGSLWLKPNDGQVERLTYQGTSGIFGARNVEGCAIYITTSGQDVEDATITQVGFETTILEDSEYVTRNPSLGNGLSHFEFDVEGLWRVSYTFTFDGSTAGSISGRFIQDNPSDNTRTRGHCFIAASNDQGGGSIACSQVIYIPRFASLACNILGFNVSASLVEAMVTFELIRPDQDTRLL